jgi:hypothetical protein
MGLLPRKKLSYNLVIRVKLETARHQLKHGVYYLQTVFCRKFYFTQMKKLPREQLHIG